MTSSSTSQGEKQLDALISAMQPTLHSATFVFATVSTDFDFVELAPQMVFREVEGVTLILEKGEAERAGLPYEFACRMITLNIHSSLDAVGFLARITHQLAKLDMGVNPVSGFYHDHLFVPVDKAEAAMQSLKALSSGC